MSSQTTSSAASLKKEWDLNRESSAELFGTEMAPDKVYSFRDQNFAVYTWYGCRIESVAGSDVVLYTGDTTPMTSYANTHIQLEARRDVALANESEGPRVIIVGPVDTGKSTLSHVLTAYAARLDRTPILVDLDVGQSTFSISGSMCALPVDKTNLSIEEGYANINPLIYFYGHNSPQDNIDHYKMQVTVLAEQVQRRLDRDVDTRSSGLIINTCGWIDGAGFDVLLHCIKAFKADVVLVMHQDKLYANLLSTFDSPAWTADGIKRAVVRLPSSAGVVNRDATMRKRLRKNKIKEYFYGRQQNFSPERREAVNINSFVFLRVGGAKLTQGMQIVGQADHQDSSSCTLMRIEATSDLTFCIAAVLHGGIFEAAGGEIPEAAFGQVSQQLLQSNVAGYVTILDISPAENRMTILSPCPGTLPSKYLLVGSIKWME